ncbi:unnamed protein product, partial [Amoebophrya sp. A120]|eukprot:GSA120T00013695001.1
MGKPQTCEVADEQRPVRGVSTTTGAGAHKDHEHLQRAEFCTKRDRNPPEMLKKNGESITQLILGHYTEGSSRRPQENKAGRGDHFLQQKENENDGKEQVHDRALLDENHGSTSTSKCGDEQEPVMAHTAVTSFLPAPGAEASSWLCAATED